MSSRYLQQLLERTQSEDARTRSEAVRDLCPCELRFDSADVWQRILALAADDDVRVRRQVVHTMIDGSPNDRQPQIVSTLETMYQDPDPRLRRMVRKILAQFRRTGRINVG